jgi:hypothetical protein
MDNDLYNSLGKLEALVQDETSLNSPIYLNQDKIKKTLFSVLEPNFIAYDAKEIYKHRKIFLKYFTSFPKFIESNPQKEDCCIDFSQVNVKNIALLTHNPVNNEMYFILQDKAKAYVITVKHQIGLFSGEIEQKTIAFSFPSVEVLLNYYQTNFANLMFIPKLTDEQQKWTKSYFEKMRLEQSLSLIENKTLQKIKL